MSIARWLWARLCLVRRNQVLRTTASCAFGLFVFLNLVSPAARQGAFAWWPWLHLPMLAGDSAAFGLLSLLPAVFGVFGALAWLVDVSRQPWQWGRRAVTWPLLGLSFLILLSLDPYPTWRTVVASVSVGLVWLVYLYRLNTCNLDLTLSLALVAAVQGSVGAAQFWLQRDVGLAALGELTLDPAVRGVSIIWAASQPYLRAYGLTAHPNVLGATMAMILLLLLPQLAQRRGYRLVGLGLAFSLGLLGLLVSFSRTSWLAFFVGAGLWFALEALHVRHQSGRAWRYLFGQWLPRLAIPMLLCIGFFAVYHGLVLGRFVALDITTEAQSLGDREKFARVALQLIRDHPWRGVGAGYYETAAREVYAYARTVHNVPLLVAAELGLPALGLWLWLAVSGLVGVAAAAPERGGVSPLWAAWLLAGLFDVTLWFTSSWRAAVLFGIIAAHVARPAATGGVVSSGQAHSSG